MHIVTCRCPLSFSVVVVGFLFMVIQVGRIYIRGYTPSSTKDQETMSVHTPRDVRDFTARNSSTYCMTSEKDREILVRKIIIAF